MAGKKKAESKNRGSCRYASLEDLEKDIAAYFSDCDASDKIASEQGLALFLKVSLDTLRNWHDGKTCPDFQETVQQAYGEIIDRAFQLLLTGNKNMTPFVIFLLKQMRYGGYQDRIESSSEVTVNVKMGAGVDKSDWA